ncbi:GntR family transcriptional regulator [bacterium]|nr:GntR family transcriptional regulator [bacterium]
MPVADTLTLDTASGVPIYRQIIDWVTVRVAGGSLAPGEQLPTVRQMAVDLHVNVNTVSRAYLELERMDVVVALQGKGTFVSSRSVPVDQVVRAAKLRDLVSELLARGAEFGFTASELSEELSLRIEGDAGKEKS